MTSAATGTGIDLSVQTDDASYIDTHTIYLNYTLANPDYSAALSSPI